ncbi:MAG: hypothetical protein ACOVP1_00745 [Bacteroidia bacterium]
MRPIIFLLFFLLLFSCKQDNKVSYRLMNIGDISYQNAIKDNKTETVYLYSKNKSIQSYASDTIGLVAFNEEGNPTRFEWYQVMGLWIDFEYFNQNLPSKKEHQTDTDFNYHYSYSLNCNSNRLFQYWIVKPYKMPKYIIDTNWYEFNKIGQLTRSRTSVLKAMTPRRQYISEYIYNTKGLLQTKTKTIDTLYHKVLFKPDRSIPIRIVTRYFYSNNSIDSTIEIYNIREGSTYYTETEVTYYQNMLPFKTILNDTIFTNYLYKKRKNTSESQ